MDQPLDWDKESIQRQWQPIDFDRPVDLSPIEKEYCCFYGIDFSQEFDRFEHAFGYREVAGYRLAVHYYRPRMRRSKGTFLILHGYFDHAGLYSHLIRFCLERDLSVVIYDLPGHGLSTGEPAAIDSFERYVEILDYFVPCCQRNFDEPLYLLGQSTGGAIAMAYLVKKGYEPDVSPFSQIFLLAPLVRPVQWKQLVFLFNRSKRWLNSVKRKFMECSHDQEFIRFLQQQDPLQYRRVPLSWVASLVHWADNFAHATPSGLSPLVIQGGEDTTIDWPYNLAVIDRNFTNPTFYFLPHARHHLVNESAQYRERLFQILEENIVV